MKQYASYEAICFLLNISNKTVTDIKQVITIPLVLIINPALTTGIFSDKVKSLYKKYIFNNYRPISILPVLSSLRENPT